MPYQYHTSGNFYYGSDIASAVKVLSLEDGTYNEYYDSFDNYYSELEAWRNKSVKSWSGSDIVHWISCVAREINVCSTEIMGEKFANLDGYQLSNLSMSEFEFRDRIFGSILYMRLQQLLEREGRASMPTTLRNYQQPMKAEDFAKAEEPILTSLEVTTRAKEEFVEPPSPDSPLLMPPPCKKGRGRPRLPRRKKKTEKLGRLWEFLRDLLKNPDYCPSLIVWENYEEGMFRFVHSDKVAKLWGSKKENPDMNYEKLSRAMRYYYKSQVLQPVYGRRLVYKFGPTATGWRVDNPNFVK